MERKHCSTKVRVTILYNFKCWVMVVLSVYTVVSNKAKTGCKMNDFGRYVCLTTYYM